MCPSACKACVECKEMFCGHCENGCWLLGNEIDGTQGTFTLIPHADFLHFLCLHKFRICGGWPDILPTGLKLGLLDCGIKSGMTIAIVCVELVGLSVMVSQGTLFVIDINEHCLEVCQQLGKISGLENTW
jgi:threonine dehydrogenase-like Zn-dependent dehydrogenase